MAAEIHPSSSPSLSIVLHAHVPYVLNHGHWPHGSDWLYRASSESLIPLLNILHRLIEDEVSPRLTIGLSPALCEMLADLKFADEFDKYLQGRIDQSKNNARELAAQGFEEFRSLALFWENWYTGIDRDFEETYHRDLLGAFRALYDQSHIELVTAPATQAFLPLLGSSTAIEAQVRIGVETFKKHFARQPRGIVLPSALGEGLYSREFLESMLDANGVEYFIGASASGIDTSVHHPQRGLLSQRELCAQVTDRSGGYAGDPLFLDFDKRHYPGGFRFWRQSDSGANLAQKEAYEPFRTGALCNEQAEHWLSKIKTSTQTNAPVLCVACDALAFGQRWFEGFNWLHRVVKKGWSDDGLGLVTAHEAMQLAHTHQSTLGGHALPESHPEISPRWNTQQNSWVWPEIDICAQQLGALATQHRNTPNPKLREILDQCAREVLLMQDGEWPLLMAEGEARAYAAHRVAGHINVFQHLVSIIETVSRGEFMSEGERTFLSATQERDNCFAEVSFALWATTE